MSRVPYFFSTATFIILVTVFSNSWFYDLNATRLQKKFLNFLILLYVWLQLKSNRIIRILIAPIDFQKKYNEALIKFFEIKVMF